MALRATNGPEVSPRSAKTGDRVLVHAKVENTGAAEETLVLSVEDLKEGALGKPVTFAFEFDPPAIGLRAKSRTRVEFAWTAALPEGKTAFTFRGRLVLRRADGALVGTAPLDVYVSS